MGISSATAAWITAGIAAASAATSVAGSIMSSSAQASAARATQAANQATTNAQNAAFYKRNTAAQEQTAAQQAAQDQTYADRTTALQQMRDAQSQALQQQEDVLTAENKQAETLRAQGDQAAQNLIQQTSSQNLQGAQDASKTQAEAVLAANMPTDSPSGTNPSGSPTTTSDSSSTNALARRAAEAATNVRDYGSKIAQVQSYQAPLYGVSNAVAENKIGIMPAEVASNLLQSGAGVRLLPSQTAYTNAGNLGSATDTAIQERGQQALDLASLEYGDTTAAANLEQSDATTIAANKLAQAKADASAAQSTGGIISGLGNLGLMGAGYLASSGTLSDLFGKNASNVTNHGA